MSNDNDSAVAASVDETRPLARPWSYKRKGGALCVCVVIGMLPACHRQAETAQSARTEAASSVPELGMPGLDGPASPDFDMQSKSRFPSSLDHVNVPYTGPVFELSQDYPATLPEETRPWEAIDFRTDPDGYLLALRRYCYEGNLPDWRAADNATRRWYHMPWMHVGKHPREVTHGLTWELPSPPGKLAPEQLEPVQNWAVGLFNPTAAYTIGRVWPDASSSPHLQESRFAVGAVSMKLLFTAATVEQVPYLAGSPEWIINAHEAVDEDSPKALRPIRLLQMDVAVRDSRADSTTGWVFGTFVYNQAAPGTSPWEKMVPIGLMFGNDPDLPDGGALQETKIAKAAPADAKLGFGGRLNGPVDNPESACVSCHGAAQWKNRATIYPTGSEKRRRFWFRNVKAGEAFCAGEQGLDYSLQMAAAVATFYSPKYNPGMPPVLPGPCVGLPEDLPPMVPDLE